jgi:hypothetical protein
MHASVKYAIFGRPTEIRQDWAPDDAYRHTHSSDIRNALSSKSVGKHIDGRVVYLS